MFFSRDNIFPKGKFSFLITAHYFVCVPDLEGTIYVGSAHNLVKDIVYCTIHLKYIGIPIHDFRAGWITFFLVNRVENQNEPKRPQSFGRLGLF